MTPKEKAKELVDQFLPFCSAGPTDDNDTIQKDSAKQCALIAIEITLGSCMQMYNGIGWKGQYFHETKWSKELDEIKQEIEKL